MGRGDESEERIKEQLIAWCGWTRVESFGNSWFAVDRKGSKGNRFYIMLRAEHAYPRTDAWRPSISLWKKADYFIGIQTSKNHEVLHIVCVRCQGGEELLTNSDSDNSNPRLALEAVKERIEKQKEIEEGVGAPLPENEWVARMLWESPSLLLGIPM